jgi:hypothetical protein
MVANPGHSVSIRAETNINLAVFNLRRQARISRTVSPASVALPVVRRLLSTKEYEENFKVTAEQPIINEKGKWRQFVSSLCLRGNWGPWLMFSVRISIYLLAQTHQKGTLQLRMR